MSYYQVFSIVFTIFFLFFCSREKTQIIPPKVVKGVLDLRGSASLTNQPSMSSELNSRLVSGVEPWDFTTDGTINLDGEWEFYWKEFLDSGLQPNAQQAGDPLSFPNYITVPGEWNNYQIDGEAIGGKGYAKYRLKVLLPKNLDSETIGIKIPNIGTAYELWVGNRLYGKAGKVSEVEETARAGFYPRLFWIRKESFIEATDSKTLDIVIKLSNYHDTSGGIWYSLKLGDYQTLVLRDKQQTVIDFFLFGSILIMGLYHFGLYFLRKKDSSALWFGMYCIAINLRILVTGEKYIESYFPDFHSFLHFFEYMDFVLLVPIFGKFLYSLFPEEFNLKVKKGMIWTGFLFTIPILLFPPFYYSKIINAVQIYIVLSCIYFMYVIILAIRKNRMGAKIFLIGFLFFFLIIIHDILYYHSIFRTFPLFSIGLFGFIFSQAAVLSMRFSQAFVETENLSSDLEQKSNRLEETTLELFTLTQNLEIKIQERTKDLEETKKEIEEINSFAHIVNSLSDLNSIFTEISKYFYHRFGISGTWLFLPDEKKEFLYAFKAYSYNKLSEDKYDYLINKKIPLKEIDGGMLYQSFQRKKPFFLKRIPKLLFLIDKDIVEFLEIKSFLHIPLLRKDECVGILAFSNLQEEMKLSKKEIHTITNLCSGISGAIDTNHLLQQIEQEKQKTIELNQLIKALNELSDLEDIMQAIFLYILGKFHFPYYTITLLDPQHNLLKHAHSYLPENLSEKDVNLLKSITLSLDSSNTKSLHMKAIMDRKPFYVLDAESVIKTERGKYILSVLNHKSFVILPIILQNQPIGTLELFSQDFVSLYEDDLIELSFLSEQLAGIIKRSLLMSQIQEEKEKAIVAQIEIEMQKKETEDLNNLIKSLNEELDLKVIMQKVLDYLKTNFNIQYFALYNLDKEKTQLTMMDGNFPTHMSKEDRTKVLNFKISIQNVKGVHAFPFKAKKPFFVPRIRETGGTEEENIISKLYKISSIIILPLILNHEIIGTVDLSSEKKMKLSKADITKLSILGEQLAGIIHGSNLLKLVQEEKEKALMLKIEADVQKQETEQLNNLIKSLNEDLNINTIMQKVHTFIKMNYDINYYGLAVVDKSKEFLVTVDTFSPEFISSADKERISKFSTRVKDVVGAHALAFKSKKPFYASRIRKSGMTQEELFNQETTKLESILIIPLILQNEPIGFLDLYNAGKMELSKEDIIKLSILGEQLAGIIYGSNLLKEVQEEKEKANLAKEEADKARQETEGLNELMRNVNSVSSLIDIMSFIMYYLETEYNFNDFYLLLNEESEKKLVPFSFTSTRHKEHEKQYFLETRIDHSDLQGVFERIFETKRAVFVEKENIPEDDRIAKEWIEKGDFDYLFLLPLVIYDELIGILFVHSPSTAMFPSKEIRLKIERFSDLIAGSVFNAKLLKKVEEAKEIAVKAQIEAGIERDKSEKLLLNILPKDVASELKEKGFAEPELFESVSVMFTDFKGFTQIAETLTPQELIKDLDACFVQFDKISERFNLEKLKTIGDSYMCAGGIPKRNTTHAIDCCLAALEIQSFMNMMKKLKEDMGFPYWELRLGIHSGSLVAGVIGEKKFAYDVWGDTVNTASRMESSGTPGKINISYSTYELVKHLFDCEYRGKVSAKNKGVVKMYYLNRIKPEYSKDEEGLIPNGKFWSFY